MKGRKRILLLLLSAVCVMLLASACKKHADIEPGEDFIYCLDGDFTGLVKIAYDIPDGSTEEKVNAVLQGLAAPTEDIEHMQAIPEEITVQGCRVDHSIAYIDFNSAYLDLPLLEEKLTRAAIVQSLLQIDEIKGVLFTVNEESLKENSGAVVGVMTADDFVENVGTLSSYETDTLTLYFANETGDKLVEQKMDVKYSSNISKEKLIVEKLMMGPKKSGASPALNPNASLLAVTIKDGICYVNFDSEFLVNIYDVKPEVTIYSIVNSLIAGTQAEMVQFTVNGEKNVTYMESIDLSQPFMKNLELLETAEVK